MYTRAGLGIDGDRTYQRRVVHAVDDNTLVLWCVLGDTPKMGLQYVVSVEEWHLSVRFYPNLQPQRVRFGVGAKKFKISPTHLVFGVLGKVVEGRYV